MITIQCYNEMSLTHTAGHCVVGLVPCKCSHVCTNQVYMNEVTANTVQLQNELNYVQLLHKHCLITVLTNSVKAAHTLHQLVTITSGN